MATASDETMTPVRIWQLSRSTSSWHLRTQLAGSPWVSWNRNSTGWPISAALGVDHLLDQLQVRMTWLPSSA